MSGDALLSVTDLRTYLATRHGVVRAVDGVSLEVREAEVLGVVGESGCGKSVTCKTIMGLMPRKGTYSSGEVVYRPRGDANLLTGSQHDWQQLRGAQLAMIFQDPMTALNPVRTIGDQLIEAVTAHAKLTKKQAQQQAISLLVRGGFPEIRPLDDRDRIARYNSYIGSIVERDIAPVAEIRRPDTLRRLINQLAHRTAEELNVASLCTALGARKETVNNYLDVLSRLGIVHRLGAWTASGARKEVRSPKLHFMDTGCATALRGEDTASFGFGADPMSLGHVLESFVFCELEKSLPFLDRHWELYHWRYAPREIDIVAQAPGRILALFEMKASTTVAADDFRHVDWFLRDGPGKSYKGSAFVVYLGDQVLSFGPGRLALPLSMFWSFPTKEAKA